MRAVEIARSFGPPDGLRRGRSGPAPDARARRSADRRGGGRREPPRRPAAARQVPAAAGRLRHSRASRSPARRRLVAAHGRHVRWQRGDAVCALVAGGGYAEHCAVPQEQCLPVPEGLSLDRGGGHSRDLLHRVDQRVRARPPAEGRDVPRPRRHRAASARPRSSWRGAFGARVFADRRHRRRSARRACGSAPTSPSTTARPTGWPRRKAGHRRPRRRSSSSTWSAATTWRAISDLLADDGRLVRSRS